MVSRRGLVVGPLAAWSLVGTGALGTLAGCSVPSAPTAAAGAAPLPQLPGQVQRIAFGSCLNQEAPEPNWQTILDAKPDLMLFGGDNVYASEQPWVEASVRQAYVKLGAQPGFQKLRSSVPMLAIWDDHDYGLNDGGAGFTGKQASKDAFLSFWQVPANDPRRAREGLYHAATVGAKGQRVQVILLDARWFRSGLKVTDQRGAPGKERYLPDSDPNKTMLGEAQWAWLAEQLRQPADVRLIVSGVQVVVDGHGWEGWHTLPHEQARLLRMIDDTRANGVVLLSGDRHIGAMYRRQPSAGQPGRYALTELTSSGLTHAWAGAKEAGPNRLGDLVTVNHFALIELDWARREVRLQLRALADGAVVQQQALALDALR